MADQDNGSILACGTLSYREQPLERALAGIARAGFPAVEIGCVCGYCEHIQPERMTPDDVDALDALVAKHRLVIASIAGHIDLAFPLLGKGPAAADEGYRRLRARVDVASRLGVEIVNTGVGVCSGDAAELASFHERFGELLDYAAERGVSIGLESHAGITETARATIAFCKQMGRGNLGVNYDAANVRFYTGMDPVADLRSVIDELAEWLIHVHIKDHAGGRGEWDFPPLGEGSVDFAALAAVFREVGYRGPYSLEIEFKGPDSGDPSAGIIDKGVASSYRFMKALKLEA